MRECLAPEHIPADPSVYWADMVREHGRGALSFHQSLYVADVHHLRVRLMFTCCGMTDRVSVIEPGCGAGVITQGLATIFREVEGFDSCADMVRGAPKMPNAKLWVEDADTWVPKRRYSVAFLSEILEHIADPARLVRLCAESCDFLVASAPVGDRLCGERAFSLEARKSPQARMDGAGHLWTWDMEGFLTLFASHKLWFVGDVAQHAMVLVRTAA